MNQEKIKKINVPYLLAYIFVPIAVTAVCYLFGYLFFYDGGMGAVILFMVPPAVSILWWIFGGRMIFRGKRKKLMRELEQSGFQPNHTFDSDGCTVIVDIGHGKLALLSFWNPFQSYILPASRIANIRTDDGKSVRMTGRAVRALWRAAAGSVSCLPLTTSAFGSTRLRPTSDGGWTAIISLPAFPRRI